ncbi:MAG: xanthine dehydrogenase family protein molybdopterin-binding subunit [Lachnospiraceae bacterium]|nr:xanthine dehydrogenase family protein molybdopterin-binding subunit [Candidatus Equihabitans merdae]
MSDYKLTPCEKYQAEGREWDRLVVKRKDTTGEETVIGHTQVRKDGVEKVTGTAVYGADINFPGQLYGVCARSPHAHARILSINTDKAKALPGVVTVITGADYPEPYGQFIADQPIIALDKVRYQGEPVAAIAAETEEIARAAAELVEVEYELLPVVNDLEESMKNETLIHEDWSKYECSSACFPVQGTNIGDHFHLCKGDVEKGFEEADLIVESEFRCGQLQHTLIETHTATAAANPYTKELQVWTPNQSPFSIRALMGKIYGVSNEKVRLTMTHIGGGFGGKYEAKCEPIALALSLKCGGRHVKLTYDRHEEFSATVCRSTVQYYMKTGVKKDGTIVANQIKGYWDAGAYVTTNPRVDYNAGFAANGPYEVPNVKIDTYVYMTNRTLGTAYRGFGVTEASTLHEHQMDIIARKLDMDPLELRLKNCLHDGSIGVTGEIISTCAVDECLRAAAANIGWDKLPKRWVDEEGNLCGKGIACFNKLTGTPSTTSCIVKMNENGSIYILSASREMGQGVTTTMPQFAAESLKIDLDKVSVSPVDTHQTPYDKTTTSSRSTFHSGNAILQACEDIKKQLCHLAAIKWKCADEDVVYTAEGNIQHKTDADKCININNVGKSGIMHEQDPVIAIGRYGTSDIFDAPPVDGRQSKRPTVMWMIGAQAAIVKVNPVTGRVKVTKIGAAHDIGKAINPTGCLQQIEGSVVMGLGHAIMEEMIYEDGNLRNGNMVDYKVPTFMDSDIEIKSTLVENGHPEGPFGVKGIGEPGLVPTAACIANAICHACNTDFKSLPIKPEHILFREEAND